MTEKLEAFLQSDASRADKCLLCLLYIDAPASPAAIKERFKNHGLPASKSWNISEILSRTKGQAIRTPAGWKLSAAGMDHLASLGFGKKSPQMTNTLASLRSETAAIASADTRKFLEEAILCLENGCFRAAVVMSWVAAVHILHNHVVSAHLAAFNAEALKRDPRWILAKNEDGLAKIGEAEFLDIASKVGAIQKNVKAELKGCLDRRNACGHPNSYKLAELTACHHVEVLITNVFSLY